MEDVLALYALPYDARYPTVCLDEKPVVSHVVIRAGLPPAPGHVERRDYEYKRHSTANLVVMVELLAGWRHVAVTERRTKRDYAEVLRYLVEERYPDANRICVAQDNLNTHTADALYEAFPRSRPVASCPARSSITRPSAAAGSTRPRSRSASSSAAASLARPVGDVSALEQHVRALKDERSARHATIDWQFANQQARVKLKKLYPVIKAQLD